MPARATDIGQSFWPLYQLSVCSNLRNLRSLSSFVFVIKWVCWHDFLSHILILNGILARTYRFGHFISYLDKNLSSRHLDMFLSKACFLGWIRHLAWHPGRNRSCGSHNKRLCHRHHLRLHPSLCLCLQIRPLCGQGLPERKVRGFNLISKRQLQCQANQRLPRCSFDFGNFPRESLGNYCVHIEKSNIKLFRFIWFWYLESSKTYLDEIKLLGQQQQWILL